MCRLKLRYLQNLPFAEVANSINITNAKKMAAKHWKSILIFGQLKLMNKKSKPQ